MSDTSNSPRLGLSGQGRDCTVLHIRGMTCGSCANAVQSALASVPGVVGAEVDLGSGTARVTGSAPVPDLEAAVERAGYKVAQPGERMEPRPRAGGCGCGC